METEKEENGPITVREVEEGRFGGSVVPGEYGGQMTVVILRKRLLATAKLAERSRDANQRYHDGIAQGINLIHDLLYNEQFEGMFEPEAIMAAADLVLRIKREMKEARESKTGEVHIRS